MHATGHFWPLDMSEMKHFRASSKIFDFWDLRVRFIKEKFYIILRKKKTGRITPALQQI